VNVLLGGGASGKNFQEKEGVTSENGENETRLENWIRVFIRPADQGVWKNVVS